MKNLITPAKLAGRCANGYERGSGSVIHLVRVSDSEMRDGINAYAHSLCGKTHGSRSAGWSIAESEPTCQKCIKLSEISCE